MKKKILKRVFLLLFIIAVIFFTLSRVNFLDYEKPIKFDKINQINFADFRGLDFFQKSLYGNEHFAYVKTTIDYEFEKDSIKIESFFHPSSSFVYNKKTFSKDLLRHEMYHFRITELYVRIAKNKISKLIKPHKEKIKDLIREIENEENNYQIKYDYDTFHSYVESEQKKYEKEIDSLLYLHSKFKNPKLYINEN
ncbi:hypothetical protein MW871_15820 [Flavobacterium sp. I-SCBP12n]|uniref:DUF922 domain-containing protein n=1 Tax=Flavobacterium pygoscelis TaxID=2893176 RepID=A0A9X1XU86_9FLAO|nr:hypothetical protein [Flavobacterium pygoscelis]MCK8143359.1 hypothetical protein [Flavobacterium pygoscelis]